MIGVSSPEAPNYKLKFWLQCYAVYVGVMLWNHPEAVLELTAYMVAIIRASEDYSTGWQWSAMVQHTVDRLRLVEIIPGTASTLYCICCALLGKLK